MTENMTLIGVTLVVSLALVHLFACRIPWLKVIPPALWTSFAGGISIAYIFLDIFPELSEAQLEIEESASPLVNYAERHVYLLSLIGLAAFYGLEKLAVRSRRYNRKMTGENATELNIFWIHIGSFALYNAVLGYLLRESAEHGWRACMLLFITLALHFVANDLGLRIHHKRAYDRVGRWILAGAILAGWAVSNATHLDEAAVAAIWALIAGGIILNVLKEELPEKTESHFGLFATGAGIYAAILLLG
ncbi:MAG: hypothetical protein AAFR12_14680 [Cyanobacteria bacterium J06626_6]